MADWDVIIIGAGAAGMMCAATAGYQGKRVLLLDHAKRAGKKILMSGGGRCNFTNLDASPSHYFSDNPHFCISALKRYTPYDFLELVERHGIDHVEKAPGQLFCADSSKPIVEMLLTECEWAGVTLELATSIDGIHKREGLFELTTHKGNITAEKVVVATGGLSIPTMGATGFGYEVARQFGLAVLPTRPALVPFTLTSHWKAFFDALAGISVPVSVTCNGVTYREALLITHRGLSGPAMLKASSHWLPGDSLFINWLDKSDSLEELKEFRQAHPRKTLQGWLTHYFSKRLAQAWANSLSQDTGMSPTSPLAEWGNAALEEVAHRMEHCEIKPAGTEGWRTAEVTMGGVETRAISSKTMEANDISGLYFIGEVLDVTGQLGGYNFQWAWASGVACGLSI
ncbi:hypothetical protein LMG33818_001294 [Halomonadaceae bacterium LMG 33818]|uniref:NAD(P)/FAD-dependent oxidoreductase n=1 Tax=Cernens ardua TaxID=3402176 RepID=UPI003EDBB145